MSNRTSDQYRLRQQKLRDAGKSSADVFEALTGNRLDTSDPRQRDQAHMFTQRVLSHPTPQQIERLADLCGCSADDFDGAWPDPLSASLTTGGVR